MYRPSTRVEPDKPLFPPAVTASLWQHTSDPVISLTISKFFFKSWIMLCGEKTGVYRRPTWCIALRIVFHACVCITLSCFWYVCLMKDRVISCSCRRAGTTQTVWGLLCWEACGETCNCGWEIYAKIDIKTWRGQLWSVGLSPETIFLKCVKKRNQSLGCRKLDQNLAFSCSLTSF